MNRIIIAGSRSITDHDLVYDEFADFWSAFGASECQDPIIVSGGARGVDSCAKELADIYHLPYVEFEADWDQYGKAAGFIRNDKMANFADCCLVIWDGKSKGAKHMVHTALDKGLITKLVKV